MEAAARPTMGDFPTIVHEAWAVFGDVCDTAAARRPCAAYLTGLMSAAKKTGSGINRACVVTTDPSCRKRWLHEVAWDVTVLNDRRLAWLQGNPKTRDSARGGMAMEHTLVDHAGQLREDVG